MKHKLTQRPNERSHEREPALGNVLIVCPGALENGGGIGRQMGYFLRARDTHDINLRYQVVDSRGPWFLGSSRMHSCLAAGYLAGAALKLIAARIAQSPCIAHINITGRGSTIRKIIITAVARAIGLRYILHVHDADYGNEYCRHGRLMKYAIRKTFHGAEKVLVLGGRDRKLLLQLMELASERVSILHNAVPDPQPDHPVMRAAAKPCHLLFLGYLSERKGVPELLRALASPKVVSLNWRATLAGGGPVDDYRRLAMDLGIARRIEFPGWLDQTDVGALCGDAEVLVLPSHAEGLAMSVLEGLSYGLAVITTPVGAHTEVIEPDISGILVAPGDVEGLADALARVISDEHLRSRLQAGARQRFLEGFDVRVYARRLVHEHANLLSRQPGVEGVGKGAPSN
jgi:glycosyltransferase involved in cell wall biosynthesis